LTTVEYAGVSAGCSNLSFAGTGVASLALIMLTGSNTSNIDQICKCLLRSDFTILSVDQFFKNALDIN